MLMSSCCPHLSEQVVLYNSGKLNAPAWNLAHSVSLQAKLHEIRMTFCMSLSRVRWIIITFGAPTHIKRKKKSCMTWVTCVFPSLSKTPLSCQCFRLWSRILGVVPCQRMENSCTCFSFRVIASAYLLKLKRNCKRLELRVIRFLQNNRLQKAERSKWVTLSSRSELL